jgi:hypothetical protein
LAPITSAVLPVISMMFLLTERVSAARDPWLRVPR